MIGTILGGVIILTENGLLVVSRLGDRDGDSSLLAEAVAAFRNASEVLTLDRNPDASSLVQMNLADALGKLGTLRRDCEILLEARRAVLKVAELASSGEEEFRASRAQAILADI